MRNAIMGKSWRQKGRRRGEGRGRRAEGGEGKSGVKLSLNAGPDHN